MRVRREAEGGRGHASLQQWPMRSRRSRRKEFISTTRVAFIAAIETTMPTTCALVSNRHLCNPLSIHLYKNADDRPRGHRPTSPLSSPTSPIQAQSKRLQYDRRPCIMRGKEQKMLKFFLCFPHPVKRRCLIVRKSWLPQMLCPPVEIWVSPKQNCDFSGRFFLGSYNRVCVFVERRRPPETVSISPRDRNSPKSSCRELYVVESANDFFPCVIRPRKGRNSTVEET